MIGLRVSSGFLLAVVFVVAPACEASRDGKSDSARPTPAHSDQRSTVAVARCGLAIVGNADPRWRENSTVVGNLGFYGPGRDFRDSAQRSGKEGDLVTKLPVIIEGLSGATVWVPRTERNRVALLFGHTPTQGEGDGYLIEDGYAKVRFEPCADKRRTGWPGGFVLKDQEEIVVKVRLDGANRVTIVTLGRLPASKR
jgi:hypothetical protein